MRGIERSSAERARAERQAPAPEVTPADAALTIAEITPKSEPPAVTATPELPPAAYATDTRASARTAQPTGAMQVGLRIAAQHGGPGALPPELVRRATDARVPYEIDHFSRAGGKAPDAAYHANAVEAGIAFARAYDSRAVPMNGREILALERSLHEISARGERGDRNYLGLDSNYLEECYRPGQLRSDEPLLRASGTRPQALDYVRHVLAELHLGAPLADGPVPIAGVPTSELGAVNRGGTHLYPLGGEASFAPWFDAAAKHLAELGPAPRRGARADARALGPIARFYHTLVNAKPFEQINNSLLMGQVNVLLARHGFSPVSHAWLDHVAFRTSPEQFAAVFAAHVAGRVKAPSDYGLTIPS